MSEQSTGLDIIDYWRDLNDGLIKLVDYIPDDKLNYSPKRELWNFRGTLLHIATARDGWLSRMDGEPSPDVWRTVREKPEIQQQFARTWQRLERVMRDPAKLAGTYEDEWDDGTKVNHRGHWIAFHLLEHDIHHRADILHYLAMLDITIDDFTEL